jgi:hypothetical protein
MTVIFTITSLRTQITHNHFFSDAVQSESHSSKISKGLLANLLDGCLYIRHHAQLIPHAANVHSFSHYDTFDFYLNFLHSNEQDLIWYVVWSYWNKNLLLSLSCTAKSRIKFCVEWILFGYSFQISIIKNKAQTRRSPLNEVKIDSRFSNILNTITVWSWLKQQTGNRKDVSLLSSQRIHGKKTEILVFFNSSVCGCLSLEFYNRNKQFISLNPFLWLAEAMYIRLNYTKQTGGSNPLSETKRSFTFQSTSRKTTNS